MKIYSIHDPEFVPYGKVLEGYDPACLLKAMETIPLPEAGVAYEPSIPVLETTCLYGQLQNNAYGGMPVQLGFCNGHNTRLNCLEYHRDSEVNCGTEDFILLVAKADDIVDGRLDTSSVKAFRAPAGTMVEVYATTLHYAPCSAERGAGFKVLVVLPRGTNGPKPEITPLNAEDKTLWACNKWLLAHPDSDEAAQGAYAGITGKNIDIYDDI